VSNGPVAKLKVTGVARPLAPGAARLSAQRENRAAIIVSYDDHAGVYLFAVAPVIYDENASADTLYIRPRPMYITCIDDASIFHRKVPKRGITYTSHPFPPSSLFTNPLPSNMSSAKLEVMCRTFYSAPLNSVGIRLRYREIWTSSSRERRDLYYSRFILLVLRMIKIYFKHD